MPSFVNFAATGLALASAAMAQELTTVSVPTSVPHTTATTCQTVTVTGELCPTFIRPACLVMSTVTPRCDCPTPGVIPTVTKNWPCDGPSSGLGCETTYVAQPIGIRCSSVPPHQNTTLTQTETHTTCPGPGGCPHPPKPTVCKGDCPPPPPPPEQTETHTTTLSCKGGCPSGTGAPVPPPASTPSAPVTAGAAILRPFWVL